MCEYCDGQSEECCVWTDTLDGTSYLDIVTSQWDKYDDDFVHHKEYISFCPFCGRRLADCSKCVNYNWEQAAKYFGHPCNLHGCLKDECTDFKSK